MKRQFTRRRRGFSLIEILVVVAIIAILAAVVAPKVMGRRKDAEVSAAIATIQALQQGIRLYSLDCGSPPKTLDALITNTENIKKWNGTYLENQSKIPVDPWGTPYIYKTPGDNGREYDIISAGPDKQTGTADDIKSFDIQG